MLHKHIHKYHQLLVQMLLGFLALHLVQCQGNSTSAGSPSDPNATQATKPVQPSPQPQGPLANKLDERVITGIKSAFLKEAIQQLQAGKPVDIAQEDPTTGETPITSAVKEPNNQLEILQYLLKNFQGTKEALEQKINQSANGKIALLWAMQKSTNNSKNYYNTEVMKLLVENGADPYAIDDDDNNLIPMLIAVVTNDLAALQSLRNNKAGYNGICIPGLQATPLHVAASKKNNKDIIEYLIKEGADRDAKDSQGFKPVDYATNPDIKALLQLDNDGMKPVDDAIHSDTKALWQPGNKGVNPIESIKNIISKVKALLER